MRGRKTSRKETSRKLHQADRALQHQARLRQQTRHSGLHRSFHVRQQRGPKVAVPCWRIIFANLRTLHLWGPDLALQTISGLRHHAHRTQATHRPLRVQGRWFFHSVGGGASGYQVSETGIMQREWEKTVKNCGWVRQLLPVSGRRESGQTEVPRDAVLWL